MRKIIYAINLSIDGCAGHTSFRGKPDEELFEYFNNLQQDVDMVVYGRKMYEIMFPYWANEANWGTKWETEFGQRLTGLDKVVFSRSLESAKYNTRVVGTDPVEELLKLKQMPGKNISLDTVSMVPLFAQAGLIDEYHLVIHPVVAGKGPRLVEDGILADQLDLKLVAAKSFKSGCVALHYARQSQ